MTSVETIKRYSGTPVSTAALNQEDLSVYEKECCSCFRIKPFNQFPKDTSRREGVKDQCNECMSVPRLSMAEHQARLREINYYSNFTKSQRWDKQELYEDERPRFGRRMHHSEFLRLLQKHIPYDLYFTDGRIVGDIAVYRVFGTPQANGNTFQYLWYVPTGWMPQFSIYEFSDRNIPIREKQRGWATPLLRLIKLGLISEEKANKVFPSCDIPGGELYRYKLYEYRNRY